MQNQQFEWTIREVAIASGCLFIMLSIFLWNLPPNPLIKIIVPALRAYLIPLGLNQEWKMFAPNPANTSYYVRLRYQYPTGTGEMELKEFRRELKAGTSPNPKMITETADYNGNGYRMTALSKLQWNIAGGILLGYRDGYLRYHCQEKKQNGETPTLIALEVSSTIVPSLYAAHQGAVDPITQIPELKPNRTILCSA